MAKQWSEDELYELDTWAEYGEKGMPCPWRIVAERVNQEFGNNRSVEACRQRWAKYVAPETDNKSLKPTGERCIPSSARSPVA